MPSPFTPVPRSTVQTDLTRDMRTICIGRLMMDIPAKYFPEKGQGALKVQSSFNLFDKFVALEYPVTLDEYNRTVETQWQEINTNPSYHDLSVYEKPPEKLSPRPNGYILAYRFGETYSTRWVDGELVRENVALSSDAMGYYWVDGTMFTIKSPGSSTARGDIADIIQNLSGYDWSTAPTEPGICLYQGFFEKYYAPEHEQVNLSIDFTDQFGISLIATAGAGRDEDHPTELRRTGAELRAKPTGTTEGDFGRLYSYRVYRADDYKTAHFNGEEIVQSISSGNPDDSPPKWENEMMARWEVVGDLYDDSRTYVYNGEAYTPQIYYPDIVFQMSVTAPTDFKPQDPGAYPPVSSGGPSPTQEAFFAVWDAMVDSIRPYPGAFDPAPQQQPNETKPGPSTEQISSDKQALDDFLGNS